MGNQKHRSLFLFALSVLIPILIDYGFDLDSFGTIEMILIPLVIVVFLLIKRFLNAKREMLARRIVHAYAFSLLRLLLYVILYLMLRAIIAGIGDHSFHAFLSGLAENLPSAVVRVMLCLPVLIFLVIPTLFFSSIGNHRTDDQLIDDDLA